jgi:hypothetical protein
MPLDPDLVDAVRDLDEPELRRLLMLARARLERHGVPILSVEPKVRFRQQSVRCGKDNCTRCPHGPYWYAYWNENGQRRSSYLGKLDDDGQDTVPGASPGSG